MLNSIKVVGRVDSSTVKHHSNYVSFTLNCADAHVPILFPIPMVNRLPFKDDLVIGVSASFKHLIVDNQQKLFVIADKVTILTDKFEVEEEE